MAIATDRTAAEWNLRGELLAIRHDFDARHVHCSNCRHAVVGCEESGVIVTRCELGLGRGSTVEFGRLIRDKGPACFRKASECPGFTCMTDGCDEHTGTTD